MGSIKYIINATRDGNCAFVGLRGRGKDMLSANCVVRRKEAYASNVYYGLGYKFIPFNPLMLRIGNDYRNFLTNDIKRYVHPFPDGVDFWISDAGVIFPSQYDKELSKLVPDVPTYMALSRQLADANVHFNCQSLTRVWLKIREQCDSYINCDKCIYIPRAFYRCFRRVNKKLAFWLKNHAPRVVIQRVTVYDKEESCATVREPYLIKPPLLANRDLRLRIKTDKLSYTSQYGHINRFWLIYKNKSNYNTRIYKEILENGV